MEEALNQHTMKSLLKIVVHVFRTPLHLDLVGLVVCRGHFSSMLPERYSPGMCRTWSGAVGAEKLQ